MFLYTNYFVLHFFQVVLLLLCFLSIYGGIHHKKKLIGFIVGGIFAIIFIGSIILLIIMVNAPNQATAVIQIMDVSHYDNKNNHIYFKLGDYSQIYQNNTINWIEINGTDEDIYSFSIESDLQINSNKNQIQGTIYYDKQIICNSNCPNFKIEEQKLTILKIIFNGNECNITVLFNYSIELD